MDTFVFELGVHHPEKCDQIVQMKLTAAEWKHVGMFSSQLAVCSPSVLSAPWADY